MESRLLTLLNFREKLEAASAVFILFDNEIYIIYKNESRRYW